MRHKKVEKHWDENADVWYEAAQKGYDIWRDYLNTPAFFNMLPDVADLSGLDIGCGDGHNSRLLAQRCKSLVAVDLSDKFIELNKRHVPPRNLIFQKACATDLPFPSEHFDFITATMSFMDMAEWDAALAEIYRVLSPTGFLQFSIIHPCFNEHLGQWVKDENGKTDGFLMKNYFEEMVGKIHEWQHIKAPPTMKKFKIPRFSKPLSRWFNSIIKAGFSLEEIYEPYASDEDIALHPELATTRIVAHSLIVRVRKNEVYKEPFRKIIEKLPGNVWWKDKNLKYLGCNDRVINVLGLASRKDFIGKTDHQLWDKEIADKLKEADLYVLKTGETLNLEEVIVESDGSHAIMLTNKSPLYDDKGNIIGIVGTSTNITDRKEAEAALVKAKEEAEAANASRTEFIRNMEHDIRTPFSGIYGMIKLLFTKEKDADKKEQLGMIMNSAKELLDFCNDILDISRTEFGVLPIIAKKFDLKALIQHVVIMEDAAAMLKQLTMTIDYPKDVPNVIVGDQHRVERVLLNLVGNAIKFTDKGYVKISVKIVRKIKDKNIILRIFVEDTGIGIPHDKQNIIYEKFTRISPSYKGLHKGTGLGLSLVKQLMEELDGELELHSELGKGSIFSCTIPFKLPLVDDLPFKKSSEDD